MPSGQQPSQLREFAKLIGSRKGTHPIPPDQYTSYQDRRYPLEVRLWSFLTQCAIAPGHRTGPCTDNGQLVTVKIAARALGVSISSAQTAFEILVQEGRARMEGDVIWISGDFQLGKRKANLKTLYNLFPKGCTKQINNLPESSRMALIAETKAEKEADDLVTADLMAAKRYIFNQRQDSILGRYGVKVKREEQKAKNGKEAEKAERDRRVLRIIPEITKVVQPLLPKNVVQAEVDGCTADSGAAYLISSTETEKELARAETPTPDRHHMLSEQMGLIADARRKSLRKPNEQTVANFLKTAASAWPAAPVSDIARLIFQIVIENEGISTWGGVYFLFKKRAKAARENVA